MQIDYVSDIHIDQWTDDLEWLNTKKTNKIIIAGDVADKITDIEYALQKISDLYDDVYYVDGNHEYGTMRFAYDDQKNKIKKLCKRMGNVHFLPDEPIIINDVGIVGVCGWWNFDFSGCDAKSCIEWLSENSKTWSEFSSVGYKVDSDLIYYFFNKLSLNDYLTLKKQIKSIYKKINKLIVVTHTSCNPKTSINTYPTGEDIRGLYGNSMMYNLVQNYDKIKYWINGHCHVKSWVTEDGVEFLNNPRGYPRDSNNNYFIETLNV